MFESTNDEEMAGPSNGGGLMNTIKVVLLLVAAAVLLSYLGAFALTNALVRAELIDRWPPGHDPRPRWMITAFAGLTGAFTIIAVWLKWTSWRQMRRLDTIANDDA